MKSIAVLALLTASATAVFAQGGSKSPNWGVTVGVYVPTSSAIQDIFGETFVRYGIAPISDKYNKNWSVSPDISVLSTKSGSNRLFVVPITASLTKSFGTGDGNRSYISFGAGPMYFDYKLQRGVSFRDDKGVGFAANVETGVLMGRRLSLEARYDWLEKQDGFDFSGFSVSATYALFRW